MDNKLKRYIKRTFIHLFNLELLFDRKVFSLGEEYPFLFETIRTQFTINPNISLKGAVTNVINFYNTHPTKADFNTDYFYRLVELNKISESKTFKEYLSENFK